MRNLISVLFIICSLTSLAEEFTVFEKDGYFGIKDQTGNVTVPAVYEKLGWSDGTTKVHNGVIGFRKNNLWGLITVRNKALTGQKFYTISPLSERYFKASIKGRFSNHLFHGILDERGRTIISFNYFTIEPLGSNWLVSVFDGKKQQFGIVSFENELIVPTKYTSLRKNYELLIATQQGQKVDIYAESGQSLQLNLDSISYNAGWVAFRDGFAGFLSSQGQMIYDFDYKNFTKEGETMVPVSFRDWTVYRQDSVFLRWKCDSLTVSKNGMLMAYLNGAHHLLLSDSSLLNNHELILKEVAGDQLIVQNSKTGKWSVLSKLGTDVISGYDSIHTAGSHFACLNEKGWFLKTTGGATVNRFPLQALKSGLGGQLIAKRNDHWGILNLEVEETTAFKYDSLVVAANEYLVSYLNRWGVLNQEEEWVVRSEFNEVLSIGGLLIGRRGLGYTVFSNGNALYKTTSRPIKKLGSHILIKGDSSTYGVMNEYGEVVIWPIYETIHMVGNHFELRKEKQVSLAKPDGTLILRPEENYQEIKGYGEEYFVVKKENRWGFVDDMGRLRISNRYDEAAPFSEGLAAVQLRGRWGFINKDESIKIQPYYEDVTPFSNGKSIVHLDRRFGLVDENGNEVLELIWKSIRRLHTGNYIVQDMQNRIGLVNENGNFIFRPSFDHLQDLGDRVLVSKNGVWGILNYAGQPIFKINHEEIKVVEEFTVVNK